MESDFSYRSSFSCEIQVCKALIANLQAHPSVDDKIMEVNAAVISAKGFHHKKSPLVYVSYAVCHTNIGGIIVRMICMSAPQCLQENFAPGFNFPGIAIG